MFSKMRKQRPKYQILRRRTTYNFECVHERIGRKWSAVHDVAEQKGGTAMRECEVSSEDISVPQLVALSLDTTYRSHV
jgi:hypothetical protein